MKSYRVSFKNNDTAPHLFTRKQIILCVNLQDIFKLIYNLCACSSIG